MTLAAKPIIPESAKGYSVTANAYNAIDLARRDGSVDILLLMHYFMKGMPASPESARKLSSSSGKGLSEVPLFGKVFHVPLPWSGEKLVVDGMAGPAEVLGALHRSGNLPDPYKSDVIVYDHPDRGTVKITQWHADDPRGERPHNHPWADDATANPEGEAVSFVSYIVRGGYRETMTAIDGGTISYKYSEGDVNVARYSEFHTVSEIQPGTLTILMCAPRAVVDTKGSEWGYLVIGEDGPERVGMNDPRVKDETFLQRAAVQNPGLRFSLA